MYVRAARSMVEQDDEFLLREDLKTTFMCIILILSGTHPLRLEQPTNSGAERGFPFETPLSSWSVGNYHKTVK